MATSNQAGVGYSLQSRLLVSLSVLLIVFLGLTSVVLDSSFRTSIEAGAAERLRVQIYVLLAAAEEENGNFYFLEDLQEPRFAQLNSGLYGFISSAERGELWRSDSANALELSDADELYLSVAVGESQFSKIADIDGEELFLVRYGILWQDGVSEYNFSVLESSAPYYSEISNFRASLWSWLGGAAFLLTLIQVFMTRWGLSPLHRMAKDLKQIESGEKARLEGRYPVELNRVTENLNLLIKSERRQQERYRTTLADLAHSLKTPLAVMSAAVSSLSVTNDSAAANKSTTVLKAKSNEEIDEQLQACKEQLERMNQIVTYQLQRAVQSKGGSSLARQVDVAGVLEKIVNALSKVYVSKGVECLCEAAQNTFFPGDERDLMELMGNVLDNAFKYGGGKVWVLVQTLHNNAQLQICVEDNGPGIAEDKQEFVLQRGARADTLARGQGIGMAVVSDIVASYAGTISIDKSEKGGASVTMEFPLTA